MISKRKYEVNYGSKCPYFNNILHYTSPKSFVTRKIFESYLEQSVLPEKILSEPALQDKAKQNSTKRSRGRPSENPKFGLLNEDQMKALKEKKCPFCKQNLS